MLTQANWITSPLDAKEAAHTFKKEITLRSDIKKATLYATAMGIYAAYINGKRIGKGVLTPGFTSYKNRVLYQEYDVTEALTKNTTLEFGLGQGWAVGYIGYGPSNHYFADHTSLIATLKITYTDGSEETVCTDDTFDVYTSEVLYSEIYHGETVDLTAPITYLGKAKLDTLGTQICPQDGEWIVENERLAPIEVIKTKKGDTLIDFGQNMTGYVEVKIKGKRGERVVIQHAEVLDKDGEFYTANLRRARNTMTYVLSGGEDIFKPTYTFEGFRYIKLVEYPFDEVDESGFTAIAVHSEMKRTADFITGNEKINQLYHNIVWGQKSNFLDIPTDCPQRDERLGWTGDAQVFCRTASINYDTEKFFTKWMRDVAIEQAEDGSVWGIVPDCVGRGRATRVSAAWGDSATVIPWQLYLAYGNTELLRTHFPMMKKWVEYMRHVGDNEYLWLTGLHYGDWLAMDAGEDSYVGATSNDLIASAFYAYSTELLIKAGEAIGEDVSEYKALYKNVRNAFREYFMENGLPKEEFPFTEICPKPNHAPVDTVRRGVTQTAIVLILHFGLFEECEREGLISKLCELIRENGGKMTTGFVGTPYILHALTDNGREDVAYSLLFKEDNPSWLYSVNHGATTMWEHWNSLKEDGSFWSDHMNSFNHYAYGAVFDWIFCSALGISADESAPAYKRVILKPHPSRELGFAKGHIDTRNGRISAHWYYKGDVVYYEYEIPEGVSAELTLPSGKTKILTGGTYRFAE